MWKVRQRGYGLFCGKITIFIILAVFLAIIPLTTRAETVQLPRTGQTLCFNGAGAEIPCAGTGQDGDIQAGIEWPSSRFTNNGDETITDNLTGLTWLRDANCMITHYSDIDVDDIGKRDVHKIIS